MEGSKMTALEIEEAEHIECKKNKRVVWVKKNLIDQTAALSYSMGVSIVHLAMFVALFFVKGVDITTAVAMTQNCIDEAAQWDYLMAYCKVCHLVLFFANLYREIFSAQTDMFG